MKGNKKSDQFVKIPTLNKMESMEVRRVSQTPFIGLFQEKFNKTEKVKLEIDALYSEEDQ